MSRWCNRRVAIFVGYLLLTMAACERSPVAPGTPPEAVLRLAGDDEIPTLDPALGYDTSSWTFELLLFEPLLDYDDDLGLVPALASQWSSSADSMHFSLSLRTDRCFGTDRPVVASDVRFAIERVLTPSVRSPGAEFYRQIVGAKEYIAGTSGQVTGIEVRDDHHIAFHLIAPDPVFLHKLAMPFVAPVPREEVLRAGSEFGRQPIGSGPFRVKEWRTGDRLVLTRRAATECSGSHDPGEASPGGKKSGAADGVLEDDRLVQRIERFSGISDQLAWLKFEAGELDLTEIPLAELAGALASPDKRKLLLQRTQLDTHFLGINCEVPPLDRIAVRQAIHLAIDRRKALSVVGGRGEVATGILPPGLPSHVARPEPKPDPDASRRLLADAGYPQGFPTTLWVRNGGDSLLQAESIAQDLAAVGIDVRIRPVSWGALLEATRTEKMTPLFLLAWQADFPDPSNFLEVLFHSRGRQDNNASFFSSPTIDNALDLASSLPPSELRWRRYGDIETGLLAEVPRVPLYHGAALAAVSPRVGGIALHPIRPTRLARARWIDESSPVELVPDDQLEKESETRR